MTAAERLLDMARVLGDTEWGASLADELRDIADAAEREDRRGENPNSKARRRRMQAHVMEVQRICAERKAKIRELNTELSSTRSSVRRIARAVGIEPARDTAWCADVLARTAEYLSVRIVPEGAEWPYFEDGEPVRIGDEVADASGASFRVEGVRFRDTKANGVTAELTDGAGEYEFSMEVLHGGRVKRPAPKVLDADGAETHAGDTVWDIDSGVKWTVIAVDGTDRVRLQAVDSDAWMMDCHPSKITHRAPVLAADGRPLREGEKVLGANGGAYLVAGVHDGKVFAHHVGGSFGAEVESAGGEGLYRLRADQLTHERPESWERLEEDAAKTTAEYWGCPADGCDHCRAKVDGEKPWERLGTHGDCNKAKGLDIVRRAKALAERGR